MEEELYNYLVTKGICSEQNVETIKMAIAHIHAMFPGDKISANTKNQQLIAIQDDLSWVTLAVKRYYVNKVNEYNKLRDPVYTTLVRNNRPSKEAIECEIRHRDNTVYDMEQEINTLNNIIWYLEHLNDSIDKYMRSMKFKFTAEVM